MTTKSCCVYLGDKLAAYGFGDEHPFGPQRHHVFASAFYQQKLDSQVDILSPVKTDKNSLALFHTSSYIEKIIQQSKFGVGYLDNGDTPAFIGMYEAVLHVAGSTLDAANRLMRGDYQTAFIPIAGLHHAQRNSAAGFCIVNDCGIVIESLFKKHGLRRVAYIDIDAHHGDGVFYSFEADPRLIFVDLHEDGQFLYPGTGNNSETGKDDAIGQKLNIPMPPKANDEDFLIKWQQVEDFLQRHPPEFILFQCGADSIEGDPITHLAYSEKAHAHATRQLMKIANQHCGGKLLVMGGGGYNHENIAKTWTAVVDVLANK